MEKEEDSGDVIESPENKELKTEPDIGEDHDEGITFHIPPGRIGRLPSTDECSVDMLGGMTHPADEPNEGESIPLQSVVIEKEDSPSSKGKQEDSVVWQEWSLRDFERVYLGLFQE